jgi:hypothetical protein
MIFLSRYVFLRFLTWRARHSQPLFARKMETPRLTDAGAGRRLRWSLDIVERCIDQWAEAAMVGCKKSVLQS